MAQEAFDLAEQFQTPVFVMLDLDLGMNNWMSDGVQVPGEADQPRQAADAGGARRSSASGAATRTSTATASRTARCPATACPPYFTRGSGHNAKGQYSERPDDYVENMDRLVAQVRDGAAATCRSRSSNRWPGAKIGFIGYGTSHWAITESRDQLRDETDVKTSYFRLRAYPFTDELAAFIDAHERVYVIEQNRDAQLLQLMRLELTPERIAKLRSVLHYNGLPIDARSVTDDVLAQEGFEVAKKTVAQVSAGMRGRRVDRIADAIADCRFTDQRATWRHQSK